MNPFKNRASFQYDSRKGGQRNEILNNLWRATIIDMHEHLWDARKAVIDAGRDDDLGNALCRPPMTEEAVQRLAGKWMAPDRYNELRNRWSQWARSWYRAIQQAANDNGPIPDFKPAPEE